MVGRAVEACFDAKFDEVFILSDSEKIRDEAGKFGANKSYERPSEISPRPAICLSCISGFTKMLHDTGSTPTAFCCVLPTTPFRPVNALIKSKQALLSGDFDWVLTINEQEHHPYRTMVWKNELEGSIEPFVDTTPDIFWANRQELPKMFRFNGGVIGGLVRHVLENSEYNISKSHDTKVKGIEITSEQSFDIDTPLELEIARWLHDKKKNFNYRYG